MTPQLTSVWLPAIKHGWSGDRPDAPLCHQNKQSLQCQVRERDCPEILPRIETITDMHGVQTLGCYVCLQTWCWSFCDIKLASAGVRFWSARKNWLIVLNLDYILNPLVFPFCSQGVMFGHSAQMFAATTNWPAQAVWPSLAGKRCDYLQLWRHLFGFWVACRWHFNCAVEKGRG